MHFLTVSLGYHPDVVGGAWRVAAAQATGLAARGHSVDVVTVDAVGNLPRNETRDGVTLWRYPQRHGHFYANWRAENRDAAALIRRRLAAAGGPVLILQHHPFLEPAVATAPARVLHTYHGPWAEEYRFAARAHERNSVRRAMDVAVVLMMTRVENRCLRRADRVLVLSRHMASYLARRHGRRFAHPEIAPGGVDFNVFRPLPDRAAARAAWQIAPDEILLVAMRRLDPRMGLDVLIDAFAAVAREFPRARLALTGRGPAEAALRQRMADHGLGDRARLLGAIADEQIPQLLNAADLALMPSLDLEGFGLATAEALACGTPVLGSRSGATPELLAPLDAGLLFEAGSVEALAARLREALSRPESLPSRERCAAYARERFSWDAQVDACERAGKELLSGDGAVPSVNRAR